MAGQLDLVAAFVEKFRLDVGVGSLVALTSHDKNDAAKFRIVRDSPDVSGSVPCVGVAVLSSHPMMGADVTHIQRAMVEVKSYSLDEIVCHKLLDRIESLLHAVSSDANRGSYEVPSTVIRVVTARFAGRSNKIEQDKETNVWSGSIKIDTIWSTVPCP